MTDRNAANANANAKKRRAVNPSAASAKKPRVANPNAASAKKRRVTADASAASTRKRAPRATAPEAPAPPPAADADVDEALRRAREHARAALREALAACAALVEASARVPAGLDPRTTASVVAAIERAQQWFEPKDGAGTDAVLDGVKRLLDSEIHRWEQKSFDNPNARIVLRALLALREMLWELAGRANAAASPRSPSPSPPSPAARKSTLP